MLSVFSRQECIVFNDDGGLADYSVIDSQPGFLSQIEMMLHHLDKHSDGAKIWDNEEILFYS